jgi:hypothetical protein
LKKGLGEKHIRLTLPFASPPTPYGFGISTDYPIVEYWVVPPPPRGAKWKVWYRALEVNNDWKFDKWASDKLTQLSRISK